MKALSGAESPTIRAGVKPEVIRALLYGTGILGLMESGKTQFLLFNINQRTFVRTWVNFRVLRAKLKFADVLAHYGVRLNCKGSQHHGPCPFPGHTGKRDANSFSANLEQGVFQCFGCGAKGNVLEFAVLMTGGDLRDGQAIRKVAVELQTRFLPEGTSSRADKPAQMPAPSSGGKAQMPIVVNAPLDFELKGLDTRHPYLVERRLSEETIAYFGLGVCSRGMLKGHLAVPLHDPAGKLIGYVGRPVAEDETIRKDRGYTFPQRREREGKILDFDRTALLYNCHRVAAPCEELVVVQWFSSVWWLHQCGFARTVALMGPECSEKQLQLITSCVKPAGRVVVMTDADEAGTKLAESLVPRLVRRCFVRLVELESGARPTDLTVEELSACLRT